MSGPSLVKELRETFHRRRYGGDGAYEPDFDLLDVAADRIAELEAERDALQKKHQQLLGIINDKHEVDPEHDSEPPIFHKGWELCARAIMRLAAPPPSGEGR